MTIRQSIDTTSIMWAIK